MPLAQFREQKCLCGNERKALILVNLGKGSVLVHFLVLYSALAYSEKSTDIICNVNKSYKGFNLNAGKKISNNLA